MFVSKTGTPKVPLDLYALAEFDYAIDRQFEKLGRFLSVPAQGSKEVLSPPRHSRLADDGFEAEEEARLLLLNGEILRRTGGNDLTHRGGFHEPEMSDDSEKVFRKVSNVNARCSADIRNQIGYHGEHYVALMKHPVVL